MRFPGQYADRETNLHYNYFRDYDPSLGIYKQSDPIGLRAGLNTYSYVGSDPLLGQDPLGLARFCCRLLNDPTLASVGLRHCYVEADDGTVYGLYPGSVGGRQVGIPRTNDPRDVGGDCFDCPSLKCGPDQNACLRNAHQAYPRGSYGPVFGPNSNTYAGTLARQCCNGGVPSGATGAPGINASPPTSGLGSRFGRQP
jgi:RHS repeat-associated protein